jgi:hypothetical protein
MPIPVQGTPADSGPAVEVRPFTFELPPLELRILAPPSSARRDPRTLFGGVFVVFILTCFASPFLREIPAAGPAGGAAAGIPSARDIPPAQRPTYDRAVNGDAAAMRMLGSMYCKGLSVPRDSQEGIHWYRLAASAGSAEAVRDLEQLGLPLAN